MSDEKHAQITRFLQELIAQQTRQANELGAFMGAKAAGDPERPQTPSLAEYERLVAAQRISRVFTDYDRQFLRGLRIAPEVE